MHSKDTLGIRLRIYPNPDQARFYAIGFASVQPEAILSLNRGWLANEVLDIGLM